MPISACLSLQIADNDLNSPPETPEVFQAYIVDSPASGAWEGHEGEVAFYEENIWFYAEPQADTLLYVSDEEAFYIADGEGGYTVLSQGDLENLSDDPLFSSSEDFPDPVTPTALRDYLISKNLMAPTTPPE